MSEPLAGNAHGAQPGSSVSGTVMYQQWRSLLFLHWPIDAASIQQHLPDPLVADTFNGTAWLGLVPFVMQNVRPAYLPAVPGLSTFPETNIRTYVKYHGIEPGVWFFSLDAANHIAVLIARTLWKLPYYYAHLKVDVDGSRARYEGQRADTEVDYQVEANWHGEMYHAIPGSLEHFLAERYLLYTERNGQIFQGRVNHSPYPLHDAQVVTCTQSLSAASGFPIAGAPVSALYSPGVDVSVTPLRHMIGAVR